IIVEVSLHALTTAGVRQLDPHLQPHTVRVEVILKTVGWLHAPAVVAALLGRTLEHLRPMERDIDILGGGERPARQVIELRVGGPVIEHADDSKFPVVPAQGAAHTVLAAKETLVLLLAQYDHRVGSAISGGVPTAAV